MHILLTVRTTTLLRLNNKVVLKYETNKWNEFYEHSFHESSVRQNNEKIQVFSNREKQYREVYSIPNVHSALLCA